MKMNATPIKIHFAKMHGLGNDFMVINAFNQLFSLQQLPIEQLANRHIGIGFDQLLILETSKDADFFCRIFNADGSEAEQCGNGLRCVARFIHENKLHPATHFCIETKAGIFPVQINDYDHIRLILDAPNIQQTLTALTLNHDAQKVLLSILSTGNPHAIMKVESIDKILTHQLGSAISSHPVFPQGANVGFMQIMNAQHIRLRTFERGVGETFACGSNACAAVCAGIANGWLQQSVKVEFRYGCLFIEWGGIQQPVHMTGPATQVYTGEILLNDSSIK